MSGTTPAAAPAGSTKSWAEKNWEWLQYFVVIPFVLSLVALLFLHTSPLGKTLAWAAIAIIDIYLFLILIRIAWSGDRKASDKTTNNFFIPTRLFSFFMLVGFIIAVVFSFAVQYVHLGREMRTAEILKSKDSTVTVPRHFNESFVARQEGVYFSAATMLTLGYGDRQPFSRKTKSYVMLQLVSAFLIFFGAFPLLISRITDFSTWRPDDKKPVDLKFIAGKIKDQNTVIDAIKQTNNTLLIIHYKNRIDIIVQKTIKSGKVTDENITQLNTDIKTALDADGIKDSAFADRSQYVQTVLEKLKTN